MVSIPQFWNWLEDRKGQNDEMSKEMWKIVETKAGEIRIAKVERKEQ